MRQLGAIELVLVPLGLVGIPLAMHALGWEVPTEAVVATMMIVAFGAVPATLLVRDWIPPSELKPVVRASPKSHGALAGAGFVVAFAVLSAVSGKAGLATVFVLAALSLVGLALGRARYDAEQVVQARG